jgi:hypothetical protein
MNKVSINGKTYTAPDGCSVSVINNKVYFNGKLAEDFNDWKEKNIEIKVEGNCKEVKADAGNITVEGNVEGDASSDAGNITVRGDIKGNAKTDCGNIKAHHIFGNANTDCGNINGASKLWNHGSSINSNNVTVCNTKGLFKNLMSKLDFFNE